MTVAATSLQAYREIQREGGLSHRQAQVLAAVKPGKDYSLSELVKLTGLPVNVISARCNELRAAGRLVLAPARRCSLTGRTVHPVKLPAQQGALFA